MGPGDDALGTQGAKAPAPSDAPGALGALVEALTLRDAGQRSARLPAELRGDLRREAALVAQRRDAAEVLARNGHPAEAWRLIVDAFASSQRLAERLLAVESRDARFPAGLGLARSDARSIERALAASQRKLPELDEAFEREDHAALALLLDAQPRLDRRLGGLTATSRELLVLRLRRTFALLVTSVACVAAIAWLAIPRREVRATASAWWGNLDEEHPRNAVDGDETTEWNLPYGTLGFLELRPSPARDLRAVRVLDIRNPPWHNVGTKRIRVTAFSGDRAVATREAELPAALRRSHWIEVPLESRGVERVRIDVLSYYSQGAGIAEVVLVER